MSRAHTRQLEGAGSFDIESLHSEGSDDENMIVDIVKVPKVVMDEDTFGMTVCSLTRDSYFIALHEQRGKDTNIHARYIRLITTLGLCLLTIAVQILLLFYVKKFVCARAVHDIRIAYDLYETTIYGAENCTLTVNSKHRGDLTKFNPSLDVMQARLATLSESDRDDICRIPMSQPLFFGLVLTIWSLTCLTEVRKAWTLLLNLMCLKTVKSMADALVQGGDDESQSDANIVGLTRVMKVIFVVLTLIRLAITSYLLWVGCRWLLATNCFSDLILNAVALEFILLLKEGFYKALVPVRNKLDVAETTIEPYQTEMRDGVLDFVGYFGMLGVAILWVVLYMLLLQQVLPGYNWDVKAVCVDFIAKRFEV